MRRELADEPAVANAVLIGAPMYSFSIPSTLEARLDRVAVVDHNLGLDGPVTSTSITIAASRDGSYTDGTPREDAEFVQN
ncbi:hypothetical protein ACFVT1_05080 [Streptomyces sp. NPDC057963]|uniref:hypothetical protein n=1 Tax=Streptomyces sp. NPDC057963 TaxID=3346290 RepID=UPI0036E59C0E